VYQGKYAAYREATAALTLGLWKRPGAIA